MGVAATLTCVAEYMHMHPGILDGSCEMPNFLKSMAFVGSFIGGITATGSVLNFRARPGEFSVTVDPTPREEILIQSLFC